MSVCLSSPSGLSLMNRPLSWMRSLPVGGPAKHRAEASPCPPPQRRPFRDTAGTTSRLTLRTQAAASSAQERLGRPASATWATGPRQEGASGADRGLDPLCLTGVLSPHGGPFPSSPVSWVPGRHCSDRGRGQKPGYFLPLCHDGHGCPAAALSPPWLHRPQTGPHRPAAASPGSRSPGHCLPWLLVSG